jgi:hypothetical protein
VGYIARCLGPRWPSVLVCTNRFSITLLNSKGIARQTRQTPTYRYNFYEDSTNTMTGTGAVNTSGPNANLDSLLSGRNIRWYKGRQAVLTAMIALVLLTSMTNGYDG